MIDVGGLGVSLVPSVKALDDAFQRPLRSRLRRRFAYLPTICKWGVVRLTTHPHPRLTWRMGMHKDERDATLLPVNYKGGVAAPLDIVTQFASK